MKPLRPADFVAAPGAPVSRRSFLSAVLKAMGLAAAAGFSSAGYAVAVEPLSTVVTRYKLTPAGWPADFPLSISLIADLHAGGPNMTVGHIRRIVDTTNLLNADLVLLLGDYFATHKFVTEPVPHPVWAAELKRLKAPLGVWAILGNHDWWYDIEGTRRALAAVDIPVLENDAVLLGGKRKFWLAGLGDQLAYRLGPNTFRGIDDLPGTLERVTTDEPVILMAHEPDIFPTVPARVAITFSGHTHGGQIRIPFLWHRWVPSYYGARFAYGHIREEGRDMIVSGGLGTSIVPMRIGVPPEVVRVELGG